MELITRPPLLPAPLAEQSLEMALGEQDAPRAACADLPELGTWFTRAGVSSSTGWSRPESPSGDRESIWLRSRSHRHEDTHTQNPHGATCKP